jgi:transcription termination factor Rho
MRRMYIQMVTAPPQGAGMDSAVATEAILSRISKTKNNQEFLETLTEGL